MSSPRLPGHRHHLAQGHGFAGGSHIWRLHRQTGVKAEPLTSPQDNPPRHHCSERGEFVRPATDSARCQFSRFLSLVLNPTHISHIGLENPTDAEGKDRERAKESKQALRTAGAPAFVHQD